MPTEHAEHQIIKDTRELRGHGPDVSHQRIYETEATRLAFMDPTARAQAIRDFDNRVQLYNESYSGHSGLRQVAQAHRFGQTLRSMDQRLRKAGR